MATRGRQTKYTADKVTLAINLAKEGRTITKICKLLEIDRQTYYNWAKLHPELKEIVDAEKEAYKIKILEKATRALELNLSKRKIKTVKTMYDADGNKTGTVEEVKEVLPNTSAIAFAYERYAEKQNQDLLDKAPTINVNFGDDNDN